MTCTVGGRSFRARSVRSACGGRRGRNSPLSDQGKLKSSDCHWSVLENGCLVSQRDGFGEQIRVLRTLLAEVSAGIDGRSRNRLEDFLRRLSRLQDRLQMTFVREHEVAVAALAEVLEPDFSRLQELFTSGRLREIPAMMDLLEFKLADVLEASRHRVDESPSSDERSKVAVKDVLGDAIEEWDRDRRLTQLLVEARSALDTVNDQARDIERSAQEAQESAQLAANAAGEAGETSLGDYFRRYAERELRSANWFRVGTLAVLLLSLGTAAYYAAGPITYERAIPHAVQVLAALGVSAYLGAQSSGHRRVGDWARAIEVQLKSFPAFIEPIRGSDAAETLYDALGKRVLSAPPKKGSKADPFEGQALGQILSILSANKH